MKRLLIIEDNASEGENISRMMGRALQCQVQVCATLQEGLEVLLSWQPEVVLLDLGLLDSGTDGTVNAISDISKSAPVIVLTGQAGLEADQLRKRAIRNGARSFVQKDHAALCWNWLAAIVRDAYLSAFASRCKTGPIQV